MFSLRKKKKGRKYLPARVDAVNSCMVLFKAEVGFRLRLDIGVHTNATYEVVGHFW